MPRRDDRIFPYSTDAISAAFTRACKVLGIEDLHFHDLRHEGVSRLFEMGWTIPQVASRVRTSQLVEPETVQAPAADRRQVRGMEMADAAP